MISFATPAWLFGLLLVPVVWYLHRSGPILRRHAVSNLDLWRDARPVTTEAGERKRADPAWIRRAACAAILSVALAGPQWPRPAERVTVWIDDSLSMRTVESGETRLSRGLQQVAAARGAADVSDFEVRTLGNPWLVLRGSDAAIRRSIESQAGSREPAPPDPQYLDRSRSHWLLTDGADATVNAWLGNAPITRVFQVAATSRNVGIAGLAVRPQPSDASAVAIVVRLVNGGTAREIRRVEILADGESVAAREVTLEPGATATASFETSLPARNIAARLYPSDALVADDVAVAGTSSLQPLSVVVDGRCAPALTKAIRAHPALRVIGGGDARLVVDCGGAPAVSSAPARLRFAAGDVERLDANDLLWAPTARAHAPQLPVSLLREARGRLDPPRASDVVLLEARDRPLIILRNGMPRSVETSLDLSSSEVAGEQALPLLVALLVDTATGETLLERSVQVGLGDAASHVAASATLEGTARAGPRISTTRSVFEFPLLLLAIMLLAWDALVLVRRFRRDHVREAAVRA